MVVSFQVGNVASQERLAEPGLVEDREEGRLLRPHLLLELLGGDVVVAFDVNAVDEGGRSGFVLGADDAGSHCDDQQQE